MDSRELRLEDSIESDEIVLIKDATGIATSGKSGLFGR